MDVWVADMFVILDMHSKKQNSIDMKKCMRMCAEARRVNQTGMCGKDSLSLNACSQDLGRLSRVCMISSANVFFSVSISVPREREREQTDRAVPAIAV